MANNQNVDAAMREAVSKNNPHSKRQLALWFGALIVGAILGLLGVGWLNELFNFIATVFTRFFQLVATPTIFLVVVTTLAALGAERNTGRIFGHTLLYTMLTTFVAAGVGLLFYLLIRPDTLPAEVIVAGQAEATLETLETLSYYDHFLSVIPNNLLRPFFEGNVLSVIILAAAVGLALAFMPKTPGRETLLNVIQGAQELLFKLISAILWILPAGILAFAAQLSAQMGAGVVVGSLGKYVAVILGSNLVQFFIILPLFLVVRGINPVRVFRAMAPALAVALFTRSSSAALPVTLNCGETRLKADTRVSRFVFPLCCTINMNGCSTFILVTSLFVMQNAGIPITPGVMIGWICLSVFAAIGNAGVPMGCYFLTVSLMSSIGAPLGLMGVILPLYAIIDMIETAENVWSDCCVCSLVNLDLKDKLGETPAGNVA